ncbi:MAG: Ig-like domain-containing protein [Gaiellaceae bacterium]
MKRGLPVLCVGLVMAGLFTQLSAAAFTGAISTPGNVVTVDKLANYFAVTPLSAAANGGVDTLSIDFGTVASARTFTSVFRITNVSSATRTANLTLSNAPQVASISPTSAALAAGASVTVDVATSSTVAGRANGTLRLGLGGSTWLYRDYSFKLDEAPEAPTAPAIAQKPAGRLDLSWTASTTVTNLAGYDVYRSSGGGYTKLTATPQTATTYSDTSTVNGTTYTYKLTAVSSGSPTLTSLDSPTVTATADATPPGAPTTIALANGGGAANAYVNGGNAGNLSVSVTLPGGSLTSDVVQLTISNGANSVSANKAGPNGAGTITFTGLNVSGLGDGGITLSAKSTDLAGNVSSTTSVGVTKDTAAPGAPTASYTDNNNTVADVISGTAEANASIAVTKNSPAPPASYSTSANGSGSYTVNVAGTNGKPATPIAVSYSITATDAAGNTSNATALNFTDTK